MAFVGNIWRVGSSLQHWGGNDLFWHNAILSAFPGCVDVSRPAGQPFPAGGMAINGASIQDALGGDFPQMRHFFDHGRASDVAFVDAGLLVNSISNAGGWTQERFDQYWAQWLDRIAMPIARRVRRCWIMRFGRAEPTNAGLNWVRDNAAAAIRAAQDSTFGARSNERFGVIDWMTVLGANPGADYLVDAIGVHPSALGIQKIVDEMATQAHRAF